MNIAAYVRVSTEEQAEKGNSIFEQQERLEAYCKAMGWRTPTFFVDDGFSAKNLKRPSVSRLLDSLEQFDIIVATKLDRVCRNLLDLLNLIEIFEKHDVRFVSASESFDTSTAAGRMTLHLLGMFAEFERERISERVKDNMISLAKNTDKALSIPCFGYDIVDGNFQINEQQAEHVRFMFEMAERGHGTRYIAKLLNDRGVFTKQGKTWESTGVKRLMTNRALTGTKIFNMRKNSKGKTVIRDQNEWVIKENSHPAIIGLEQFESVQRLFDTRKPSKIRAESESYLLTGIIYCKLCGRKMKGHTARYKSRTYYRYLCASYIAGYGCKSHGIHRDAVEKFVIEQFQLLAQSSDAEIQQILGKSKNNEDEYEQTKQQLSKLDARMQKQIEAYELDLISADDLKAARKRLDTERMRLESYLTELKSKFISPGEIRGNIIHQLTDITGTDRIKAKKSIMMLIDSIVVEAPYVDIIWRA